MSKLEKNKQKEHVAVNKTNDSEDDSDELFPLKKNKAVEPTKVINLYRNRLTDYEVGEIVNYSQVYFIGPSYKQPRESLFNNGFDDQHGSYIYGIHDHIAYRYEILKKLGKGAFGHVFKVFDHKKETKVALKIIRNEPRFHQQARYEIKILRHLKKVDKKDTFNFVHLKHCFEFRNHVCIAFELLTISLFDYLGQMQFKGCTLPLLRRFTYSIVKSLCALQKLKIIHCDLKPENIVLRSKGRSGLKIIDFGSSCFEHEVCFPYIQSRYYRAPEVLTYTKYGLPIDMWSLGCIVYELLTGVVLFKGTDSYNQLAIIIKSCGQPPKSLLNNKDWIKKFYSNGYSFVNDDNLNVDCLVSKELKESKKLIEVKPGVLPLDELIPDEALHKLKDFIKSCLILDPKLRMKPNEAIMHPFLNLKSNQIKSVLNKIELLDKSYYNHNLDKDIRKLGLN